MKRKFGLMKKAHELSVLCGVGVALFLASDRHKAYQFSSEPMPEVFGRCMSHRGNIETRSSEDIKRVCIDLRGVWFKN